MLARQLSLKGVCTLDEWNRFKQFIHYDYIKDNNFTELKDAELIQNRVQTLASVQPYIGMFYSKRWVQENVLCMDEDEIEKMEMQMAEEAEEQQEQQAMQPQQAAPKSAKSSDEDDAEDDDDINTKVSKLLSSNDTTGTGGAAVVVLEGQYGTLRSFYYNSNNVKTIFNQNVGTIDYTNGIVSLTSFAPYDIDNPLGELTINVNPTTTIVSSQYNRIITVDPYDPTAIIVNVTAKN